MPAELDRQERKIADLLAALPSECGEPYGWAEFECRARERVWKGRERARTGWRLAAMAAVVLVFLLCMVVLSRVQQPRVTAFGLDREAVSPDPAVAADPRIYANSGVGVDAGNSSSPGIGAAERWLANAPPEPVIVRFGTRVAVVGLEDRIAQVDDLLTVANLSDKQPADVTALRRERERLVGSLAQVRYAETLVAESP